MKRPNRPTKRRSGASGRATPASSGESASGHAEAQVLLNLAGLELYFELRTFTRNRALVHPLVGAHPILFLERRRSVGYMLYEYLGWYYALGNDPTSGYLNPRYPTPSPGVGVFLLCSVNTLWEHEPVCGTVLPHPPSGHPLPEGEGCVRVTVHGELRRQTNWRAMGP